MEDREIIEQLLVGAKFIEKTETGFVVEKDDKRYNLDYATYDGDCCGWAKIEDTLLISDNDLLNPVISSCEFAEHEYDCGYDCKMTLLGISKPIYVANATASSGSGWQYGATVTLYCVLDNGDIANTTLAVW